MSRASANSDASEMVKMLSGGTVPTSCSEPTLRVKITKNSSALSCEPALRMAGLASRVEPISESSMKSIRRTGRGVRARNQSRRRTSTVVTAHSGTPASRSIRRMVSMFIGRF